MSSVLTWEKLPLSVSIKHDSDTHNLIPWLQTGAFFGSRRDEDSSLPREVLLPLVADADRLMRRG